MEFNIKFVTNSSSSHDGNHRKNFDGKFAMNLNFAAEGLARNLNNKIDKYCICLRVEKVTWMVSTVPGGRTRRCQRNQTGRWSAQLGTSRACEPWNESKQVSGTSHNAWEYTAHVNKGALELNTEYVSNQTLI